MQQAPITPATVTFGDGKERVLRFSNGALKAIHKLYGVSVIRHGAGKLFESVDEDQLSKLLMLGLNHKSEGGQPGITEEEVDELLDAQNAPEACKQVFKALGASILKNALDIVMSAMANAEKVAAEKIAAVNKEPEKVEAPAPERTADPTTVM